MKTITHTWRVTSFTLVNHFILICLLLSGCNQSDTKSTDDLPFPYANTARSVTYVGSEQCQSCHEDIYRTYMESEMGRSMSRMVDAPPIERFNGAPIHDPGLNFSYNAISRNGTLYQREFRRTSDGSIVHDRTVEAEYVMGSGNNLRMYFFEEGGMLYQQPLTWYVHTNSFDLSPGYRDFGNVRFSRFASAKCLSCHNSYLTPDTAALDRYKQPLSMGIGCERCHGPGELHIKEARGEDIPGIKENALSIINPRTLPHQQQLDVCQQCHLQGKAWVLTGNNENYFDFRPGELLSTHRSVYFKARSAKEVVEVGDSPQRLSMSRCYQESGQSLTCITCHNPHKSIKSFSSEHYNQKCMTCHDTKSLKSIRSPGNHTPSSDCISCHMNRTGINNTLHGVSNTDHWIRKDAKSSALDWKSLRKPSHQPVTGLAPFLDNGDSLSDERLAEAYLYYYKEHDPRPAYLDSAMKHLQPYLIGNRGTVRSLTVAGHVYAHRGMFDKAKQFFSKAVERSPNNSELRFQLGRMFQATDNFTAALNEFSAASSLKPKEPKYLESMGMIHYRLSQFIEAKQYLAEAVALDSHNGDAYFFLGNIAALHDRDLHSAKQYFLRAVELLPDRADGHLNLGNSYLMLGEPDSAIMHYSRELARNGKSVSALINLGRAYSEKGDEQKAKSYYRKALSVDPASAAARELLYQ